MNPHLVHPVVTWLRPSIRLAQERGSVPLVGHPHPLHEVWPVREDLVRHCQSRSQYLPSMAVEGMAAMIDACVTLLWCECRGARVPLSVTDRHAREKASQRLPVGLMSPMLAAVRQWAEHTRLLDQPQVLDVWLMNILTAAISALAAQAAPVIAPEHAALITVEVSDAGPDPVRLASVCSLPPKDLGRRNFAPPDDWEELCEVLGFGWRTGNTPTCVYGWTGSWAMTYGTADRESMGWFMCGIDDHALVVRDGFTSHAIHLPQPRSGTDDAPVSAVEVTAGAMDIDLQECVHALTTTVPDTGLAMPDGVSDDLWWLVNGYDCAGPGYIWHGRAPFPDELTEMSLSIWAAGCYDIPYDCAYGNVLTHARYLIGKLDAQGVDRSLSHHAIAGCLLRNVTGILTGTDQSSGCLGTLNWYLWALVISRYSPGHLLAGAAHQVAPEIITALRTTTPHGDHLPSREAWHLACQGSSNPCATCITLPLAAVLDTPRTDHRSPVLAHRVPLAPDVLGTVDASQVDWETVEVFDRWISQALGLAAHGDHQSIPQLDHDSNDFLIRLMRLAVQDRNKVPATVALCALISMAERRNISRLLGVLNLRSRTALVHRHATAMGSSSPTGEVP
ncbi:hypothetical protein [Streptomyces sp. NBC_00370]|uniref:hypothetical protein n=1 Tax=Streptomyces sp. NBC_00370 TaxID=2975728 RepID=UPI002E252814